MNLSETHSKPQINIGTFKRPGGKRPPAYSIAELANTFGVLVGQLNSAMRRSPIPVPEPSLAIKRPYRYPLDAMKSWWEEVGGKDFAVSERAEYNLAYQDRRRERYALESKSAMTV